MKKLLFDLGANDGCSIRKFATILEDFDQYEVHSFEPGAVGNSTEMKDTLKKYSNVIFHPHPVSDRAAPVLFFDHTTYSAASTMWAPKAFDTQRSGDCGSDVSAPVDHTPHTSVNLSGFIQETIKDEPIAELIVKMDIEGEEYRVIPKMIKDEVFKHITTLYLEWHPEWAPSDFDQKSAVEQIKKQNPKIVIDATWNALGY